MQRPDRRPRVGRTLLEMTILACICCGNALGQATKPAQQPLYLPDPTPRPPDLEKKYDTNSQDLALQQRLAQLRAAQIRQQVVAATDKLLLLTEQLKSDVEKREVPGAMTPQVVKAEQIEKLAKAVKEKTQAQ